MPAWAGTLKPPEDGPNPKIAKVRRGRRVLEAVSVVLNLRQVKGLQVSQGGRSR